MIPHDKMVETVTKRKIDPKTMTDLVIEKEPKILHGYEKEWKFKILL